MSFRLSNRAREELARRDIALAEVEAVLAAPGQSVPEHGGIVCDQSQTTCDGKPCLLRVYDLETTGLSPDEEDLIQIAVFTVFV